MSLREKFAADLKESMLAKDSQRSATIRLIRAALQEKDLAAGDRAFKKLSEAERAVATKESLEGSKLNDDEILSLLIAMVKQRRESIEMYTKGNRPELAAQEEAEIAIIETYLPKQLNDAEAGAAIDGLIKELGATSVKDMGKVMGELKKRFAGQMDFGKAGALIKNRLAA